MELQGVGKRCFVSLRAFFHAIRKMDPFQGAISARFFLTEAGLASHSGKSQPTQGGRLPAFFFL